ncbi:MAG: type IV pilus modification PilV family protein [Candidatus Rifleibacteriota bacterium]
MKNLRAFSFVEIMIAIICLSVVLIPLTTMFSASSTGTIQNRNDILARQHAANLLDYSYSLPYADDFLKPAVDREVGKVSFKSGSEDISLEIEQIFKRTISIEEIKPANWKYAYKLLKVRVSWFENKTIEKEIVMTGVLTDENA